MNSVKIFGRIASELEIRQFQSGTSVLNFTVACERKMSKEKKEEAKSKGYPTADFPRCKAIGKTAENIAKYFKKGDLILIDQGNIETGSYEGQNGKVYTTEVFVQSFEFVSGNSEQGQQNRQQPMAGGGSDDGMGDYNPDDFSGIDESSDIPF